MTRKFLFLATSFACLAASLGLTGVASATHNPGVGPPKDTVKGEGSIRVSFAGLEISADLAIKASSGPLGEDPQGEFSATLGGSLFQGSLSGRVTCLSVDNHRANLAGVIEESTVAGINPGGGIIAAGRDRGLFDPRPDSVLALPVFLPPDVCTNVGLGNGVPIVSGNFIVHDGQPVPPQL